MAIPIVLSFLMKMAAKFGVKKARKMVTKKYGKDALKNITKPKDKIVKHPTEFQRVKAQIKRDLAKKKVKTNNIPKGMYKMIRAKDGMPIIVKNKPIGYVSRNFGKKVPYYTKSKSVKGSARWVAEQKKKLKPKPKPKKND